MITVDNLLKDTLEEEVSSEDGFFFPESRNAIPSTLDGAVIQKLQEYIRQLVSNKIFNTNNVFFSEQFNLDRSVLKNLDEAVDDELAEDIEGTLTIDYTFNIYRKS